jgi:hypothetical protein
MMQIENRNLLAWFAIMIAAWLLFSASFGVFFGAYLGFKVAAPIAMEAMKSGEMQDVQDAADLTAEQAEAIGNQTLERMREVDWWLWWPVFNGAAWMVTSVFLGFMKVVKYNEGLVIFTYLESFVWRGEGWSPPDSMAIEAVTILMAIGIVHYMGRWVYEKRTKKAKTEIAQS